MTALSINSKEIRLFNGLFSLNDLFKASGESAHKRPSKWLATKQAKECA